MLKVCHCTIMATSLQTPEFTAQQASGDAWVCLQMEYPVASPVRGRVSKIAVSGSQIANQGDVLAYVCPDSPEE